MNGFEEEDTRESYPTQWAYDQACKAIHKQRERAEKAEAELVIAQKDSMRLEFIINVLNRVGTSGLPKVIRWGYPGLDRDDIDAAIKEHGWR